MGWTKLATHRWDHASPSASGSSLRRLPSQALRGPTTLEEHALPAAIVACFVALAVVQVILTW